MCALYAVPGGFLERDFGGARLQLSVTCTSRPQRSGFRPVSCFEYTQIVTLDVNHVSRYYQLVIKTFKCADTLAISKGEPVKRFANIAAVARRKLRQLEIAGRLDDLRVPPGNRLETLRDDRAGQHSIRVNDQFRVCFHWTDTGAEDVEIVAYH